ncbi:hypothetical protein AAFM79_05960 [Trichormus azollae HNT15244]
MKTIQHEEMVRKARHSKRERIRYVVAESFIDILINGLKECSLYDPEVMVQLGGGLMKFVQMNQGFKKFTEV